MSAVTPSILRKMADTSCAVRTMGKRSRRWIRLNPLKWLISASNTSLYKKSNAFRACDWVDAATCFAVARWFTKPTRPSGPTVRGWCGLWKWTYRRIQNRYASSVLRLRWRRRQTIDTWSISRSGGVEGWAVSPHEGRSFWGQTTGAYGRQD